MRRKAAIAAAVGLGVVCAGPAAAVAHPLLVTAAPAPGSILPSAPSKLALQFSEESVARGSAVTITGSSGQAVLAGQLRPSDGGRQLAATLPAGLKPGVYRVRWDALGEDGHAVTGTFAFGIAQRNGAPPPGAAGIAAVGGGRGGSTGGDGIVSIAIRWLGILAASLLWGGALLLWALRRRPGRDSPAGALRVAGLVAVVATGYGVLQQAGSGAGGGLDFGLLTASGSGLSALAAFTVALAGAAAAVRASRLGAALTGLGLLTAYGLSGHVLAQGSAPASAAMALHVVAAGAWAGGLIALGLLVRGGEVELGVGARALVPIAGAGLALAAAAGAISAIREVGHWYFLWWSGYGRVVIAKVVFVAIASGIGVVTALRARRGRPWPRAVHAEAGLLAAVLALAAVLSTLAQGRGQPLPAQRGDLLPGPALASALFGDGQAPVTLAPARPGFNELVVTPPAGARAVSVRLVCGCDVRAVITDLQPRSVGNFAARIPVPSAGNWTAYVTVDRTAATAPVTLPVGVAGAAGAPVRNVLAVADLSGPGAARCRAYLTGLELAVGRLNGAGGVDGGHKLAVLALDDAGAPGVAAAVASSALARSGPDRPVAVAPCAAGVEPAAAAAARAEVPVIEGDPATGLTAQPLVYRVAGDPYADGVALAEAIRAEVVPASAAGARSVEVVSVPDGQGERRLAGLRATLALERPALRVVPVAAAQIEHAGGGVLAALLNRARTAALVLDATDAQAPALAAAIGRMQARGTTFAPAPILTSERVLSESFIDAAGDAGRLGVVQGTSTVAVDSLDGLTLAQTIPALFGGERASLEALRGYVAGLALDDGLRDGTAAARIATRLARPLPFTDAIAGPWRSDAPAAGAQRLGVLEPTFLSTTVVPVSQGGESYSGDYFSDGAWTRPTSELFGPSLRRRVTPIGGL